ncbi:hypothetical protein EPI10_032505 [Gossypium australe]|uniref:Uncharacterized protein n=1 Tax=Gossypium australe TaxID=47621 RepID=A0A5B6X4M5_9ROSI|nr:hypothetical protein EPI10_032505 [Gossypium australe]
MKHCYLYKNSYECKTPIAMSRDFPRLPWKWKYHSYLLSFTLLSQEIVPTIDQIDAKALQLCH